MALTPFTDDLGIISQLPDEPNTTLTTAELKAAFDQAALTIKDYINNTLIPELDAGIGLLSSIAAIDDTTLTNNADHIPVSSVVKASLTGATATRLSASRTFSLSGGATGSQNSDLSGNVDIPITALDPMKLSSAVPVSKGGTGAVTAAAARANLGINLDMFYPVGSIYMTADSTFNPSATFGGTWTKIEGKVLLGAGGAYTIGNEGGEATHTLTVAEMPSHNHQLYDQVAVKYSGGGAALASGSTAAWATESVNYAGGGGAHNNMPPYRVVNIWQRTA